MRAKFLLIPTISVLGLSLALFSSKARANDVVIDLSVLDSLGSENSPVINSGPLFPVVHASKPRFPEVKKNPVKKKVKPASKVAKKKTAPQKLTIPERKDVKVEVKEAIFPEVKEDVVTVTASPEEIADSPFGVVYEEPVKVETAPAPVAPVVIQSEELPPVDNTNVTMEPINGMTELPQAEDNAEAETAELPAKSDNLTPTVPGIAPAAKEESLLKDEKALSMPEPASVAPFTEEVVPAAPTPLVEISPAPLLKESSPLTAPSAEIVFENDSYELSNEDKKQIDEIISSFEDAKANKIAIYAFNFDNGEDVFRKKRLSLNRAIEVRSYLLGLGYKNFSIKVVNITEDNGKSNRVVIEELK